MAKKKFKSAATAKRFKGIGRALEASRGEIEAQTRRDVEALKTARGQHWEQQMSTIGALGDVARSESANKDAVNKLEQRARQTRFDAIVKHGETVVKKLEDEAKQKADYAAYLKELAPQRAKLVGELATQGMQTIDTIRGVNQWTALKESGLLGQITDGNADAHTGVIRRATDGATKLTEDGDAEGANNVQDRSIRLSSYWAQKKFLEWVKNNKEALRNDVIANFNASGGKDQYGESNAIQAQELGGLSLLKKLGISNTTKTGASIVEEFSSWGATDKQGFYETRKVGETTGRITELTTTLKAAINDTKLKEKEPERWAEEVQLAYTNLMLAHKNGWFKSQSGKAINPNSGRGLYGNTADAGFAAMQAYIDNDPTLDLKNINERLGHLRTPDLKGDGKTFTWRERFEDRWRTDVREYAVKQIKARSKAAADEREANGIVFNTGFQKDVDDRLKDGVLSLKEVGDLHRKIQNSGISEKQKAIAYQYMGYNASDYSSSGNLRNVLNHIATGDIEGAIRVANHADTKLSKKDRAFLNSRVTLWKEIDTYHKNGVTGLRNTTDAKVKSFEKDITGIQTISNSGKLTQAVMYENIVNRYADLRFVENALTGEVKESSQDKKKLFDQAKNEEWKRWQEKKQLKWDRKSNSYIPVDGEKYDPTNPYNYVLNKKPGESNRNVIYINQADGDELDGAQVQGVASPTAVDSETETEILNEDQSEKKNRALAFMKNEFFKTKNLQGMNPKYFTELITNGVVTEDEVFKSERIIGTQDATKIFDVLEHNENIAPSDFSFKEIPYPPQIEAIRKQFPQYTKTQILNKALYNLYGKGARVVPLDNDDCTQLKARKKTTGEPFPYVPANERAVAAYAACKAQNITPVSNAVKWFRETGDATSAFRSSMNIPEGFSDSEIRKRWVQDDGPVLEPGFTFDKATEAGLIPPKGIWELYMKQKGYK